MPGARFSKVPATTGPDNLSGCLTGNSTGPEIAFLEAPVNFLGIYRARWNSGLLPISSARFTLVHERRRKTWDYSVFDGLDIRLSYLLPWRFLKNTAKFSTVSSFDNVFDGLNVRLLSLQLWWFLKNTAKFNFKVNVVSEESKLSIIESDRRDSRITPYFIMHSILGERKAEAKLQISFGTSALFFISMGLDRNISRSSFCVAIVLENEDQLPFLARFEDFDRQFRSCLGVLSFLVIRSHTSRLGMTWLRYYFRTRRCER